MIHAPAHSESEAVAELERQLKAARTRIKNLTAEASRAWATAKANPATISKAKLRKLQKALHPDGESTAGAVRKAQLTEATQILNAIKFQMRDDSDASRVAEAKPLSESGYAGLDHGESKPSDEAKKIARKILEFTATQYNAPANRTDLVGDDKALIREALLNTVDSFGSLATDWWQGE